MVFKYKKVAFLMILFAGLVLAACQEQEQQTEDNPGTDETASSEDDKATNSDAAAEAEEQTDSNNASQQADTSNEPNTANNDQQDDGMEPVEEADYPSEQEALDVLDTYQEVEQTNTDLGHGMKGFTEGAAGHQYVSWNEGNWYIRVDFPSDPANAIENYENGEALAKEVVNYLEEHYLPAPDRRGTIVINGFSQHPETTIKWQEGSTVYTINEETVEPLDALELAVNNG
ncbi:hypothetical protein [Gracilibacillus salinarum]|uniref:Lipoprotein n=1 Tax=Gracilibacillus salinarum TaxID=2932255 RepID=A0ABY4GRQ7_9BACI|nr:hypothetical protein [Gracilibacillus salinarum]UOQ86916.1 hypothetical protein MUN87_08540 [Gracilibacillus salinarum]